MSDTTGGDTAAFDVFVAGVHEGVMRTATVGDIATAIQNAGYQVPWFATSLEPEGFDLLYEDNTNADR